MKSENAIWKIFFVSFEGGKKHFLCLRETAI